MPPRREASHRPLKLDLATPEGSPKNGFVLGAHLILDAESLLVERLLSAYRRKGPQPEGEPRR